MRHNRTQNCLRPTISYMLATQAVHASIFDMSYMMFSSKIPLMVLTCVIGHAATDSLLRRDCGSKHHIENGYIDFKHADTTLKAPVICNTGYSAKTYGKIYCQADGTWLTETCEPKDCKSAKTVKNGVVTFGNFTTYGELAKVTCDFGYQLKGHPYLVCQSDGKWTTNTTCEKVDCGHYYKIDHGYVEFKNEETTWESQFDVTCEKGYEIAGEKKTTCLGDGTWSKHTVCKPVDCGTWVDLPNGHADFTGVKTTYKEKLPIYCNVGYFRQGNSYFICDENSTWSWPEPIKCHLVECGTDHTIEHSQANFTARSKFYYEEVVPVNCDSGYELVGGSFATCQANGKWSDTKCQPKDCGADYQIEFGTINYQERWTTYKSRATVTCDKGYKIDGEEYVTCLSSGKWSTLTKCVPHDCGTVYNLEDGHVDFVEVDVTYTQKVNITCNDGYYSTTHEHIECLSDGKWSEVECRHELESNTSILIMAGSIAGTALVISVIIVLVILKRKQKGIFMKRF